MLYKDIMVYIDIMNFLKVNNNKTIILGYTKNNETLHVYKKDDNIILHLYNIEHSLDIKIKNINTGNGDFISLANIIPTRYIYPECSSVEFIELLKKYTNNLKITKYIPIKKKQYYGEILNRNIYNTSKV